MKIKKFSLAACLGLAASGLSHGAVVPVTADITADTTWTADNEYTIGQAIFVKAGATLTIEPGTKIYGFNDGVNFGSLVVTRGSKLMAEGTASRPIIFTAATEGEADLGIELDGVAGINTAPLDPLNPKDTRFDPDANGGYWGGVILLGNAPINYFDGATDLGEASIEGFPGGAADLLFGGNNPADNSGVLRYVSIQFGGFEFADGDEINGLTMGGVGNGTTIENVEVIANTDDGFEFFGGTVNTKNLVSAFNLDESFDIDQGHQGCHQFWFALQGTGSDNGSELDSSDGVSGSGFSEDNTPKALTQIFNVTYVGGGPNGKSGNDVFRMKDGFAGQFHNSVFHDFTGNLVRLDDSSTLAEFNAGTLKVNNSTWGAFAASRPNQNDENSVDAAVAARGQAELDIIAQTGNSAPGTNPQFRTLVRTSDNVSEIDPRPASGSPLLSSSLSPVTNKSCFDEVSYRGAFGDTNWANCWSYLSQKGYFSTPDVASRANVVVAGDISVDTTWNKNTNYILDKAVFVKAGATLTIEPGTHILGKNDGVNFGSLVITRGSDINANGTAEEPIVFTAVKEAEAKFGVDFDSDGSTNTELLDPNNPKDTSFDPDASGGYWGGVIILGNAPINYFDGATDLGEASIEGFPGGAADLLYGGNVANDSSGIFRYVSIQFGGFEFADGDEINGLTLGGVGSGTTIEFVEVVANTDDGFEFFGGTVATNNLVSAFNLDEAFDVDQGHTANHQFWYAHQGKDSDNGSELDSSDGVSGSGFAEDNTPKSFIKVFNATYIGDGPNGKSGNDVFRMKDGYPGEFHNSIFHDFAGNLVRLDDSSTLAEFNAGNLKVNNSIWGAFGASRPNQNDENSADPAVAARGQAELDIIAQTGNSAPDTDPCLRGTFYGLAFQRDGITDPRPAFNSPAWVSNGATLTTVSAGLDTVDYRGAFGLDNWAAGWTYLSQRSILVNCPGGSGGSSAYQTWAAANMSDDVQIGRAPLDDFNGDSLPNFASYAFDLDPASATAQAELVATGVGTANYKRLTTGDVTYQVFVSDTLPFGDTPASAPADFTETLGAITGDYQEVTINVTGEKFVKVVAIGSK